MSPEFLALSAECVAIGAEFIAIRPEFVASAPEFRGTSRELLAIGSAFRGTSNKLSCLSRGCSCLSGEPWYALPRMASSPPMPRRRVRLKVVAMVAGCLMLGLVTTVAVAWGSAVLVADLEIRDQNALRRKDGAFPSPRFVKAWHHSMGGFGAKRTIVTVAVVDIGRMGPRADEPPRPRRDRELLDWLDYPALQHLALPGTPGPDPSATNRFDDCFQWAQDARGWPFLALSCAWQSDTGPDPEGNAAAANYVSACKGGIEIPLNPGDVRDAVRVRALPLRPLYPGLIANILIYAALWYGLITLPLLLRNRSRRRRGLCPRCAYDLRGLPARSPCPECGAAAPASQA